MHEGAVSTRLGIPGIPREAEDIRIDRNIRLAELAGAHIHIPAHLHRGRRRDCAPGQAPQRARHGRVRPALLEPHRRGRRRL